MNQELKDKEWREFEFSEIFEIKKGFYNKKPNQKQKGTIPFLGATANNNGITGFYTLNEIDQGSRLGYGNNETLAQKIFKGNCIAVTNNGSVGHAFYQIVDFTCSHDINPLYLRHVELNKHIAMFIIAAIEKQSVCFEYARKWRPIRMVKSKILLPVTKEQPDYEFMEAYMREKESELLEQFKKYAQPHENPECTQVEPLFSKEWKEFAIEDVFIIKAGKRLTKNDMSKGRLPFIGASDSNNGITGYVANENASLDSNVLGVNYNGSVVENFYHPYSCIFSDDVKRFALKSIEGNKYLYLFMKSAILMQRDKYEYGYKFNEGRMVKQRILLPADLHDQPDYIYMEQYMRNLEKRNILQYLEYIESNTLKRR